MNRIYKRKHVIRHFNKTHCPRVVWISSRSRTYQNVGLVPFAATEEKPKTLSDRCHVAFPERCRVWAAAVNCLVCPDTITRFGHPRRVHRLRRSGGRPRRRRTPVVGRARPPFTVRHQVYVLRHGQERPPTVQLVDFLDSRPLRRRGQVECVHYGPTGGNDGAPCFAVHGVHGRYIQWRRMPDGNIILMATSVALVLGAENRDTRQISN